MRLVFNVPGSAGMAGCAPSIVLSSEVELVLAKGFLDLLELTVLWIDEQSVGRFAN